MSKRSCGTCTKCCEGWLTGEVLGHKFYGGKPCHFISIGKGCSVYAQRPKDPCVSFKCGWLASPDIPEWFKPDEINAIVKFDEVEGIPRVTLIEAGEVLQSRVLNWFILYGLNNKLNFAWQVQGELHWIGSPEFNKVMTALPKDKFVHSKPKNLLPVVSVE